MVAAAARGRPSGLSPIKMADQKGGTPEAKRACPYAKLNPRLMP